MQIRNAFVTLHIAGVPNDTHAVHDVTLNFYPISNKNIFLALVVQWVDTAIHRIINLLETLGAG